MLLDPNEYKLCDGMTCRDKFDELKNNKKYKKNEQFNEAWRTYDKIHPIVDKPPPPPLTNNNNFGFNRYYYTFNSNDIEGSNSPEFW